MTAAQQQDFQLQRRLQQDSIRLAGKTIYINPFLYWRRFDSNTDRWLREPGQLGEDQIKLNRGRFYPELDWTYLDEEERLLKDASVEMFLKSLDLITTFHPELNAGQFSSNTKLDGKIVFNTGFVNSNNNDALGTDKLTSTYDSIYPND